MRGVVEVPIIAFDGTKVGKVQIDKNGRMKIEMKDWASPEDVLVFLKDIAKGMDQTVSLQNKTRRNTP